VSVPDERNTAIQTALLSFVVVCTSVASEEDLPPNAHALDEDLIENRIFVVPCNLSYRLQETQQDRAQEILESGLGVLSP